MSTLSVQNTFSTRSSAVSASSMQFGSAVSQAASTVATEAVESKPVQSLLKSVVLPALQFAAKWAKKWLLKVINKPKWTLGAVLARTHSDNILLKILKDSLAEDVLSAHQHKNVFYFVHEAISTGLIQHPKLTEGLDVCQKLIQHFSGIDARATLAEFFQQLAPAAVNAVV